MTLSGAAAQAQDWSGADGALSFSNFAEEQDYLTNGVLNYSSGYDGHTTGLALGHNMQSGAFVYGAELAYGFGKIHYDGLPSENYLDGVLDLKLRAGYAAGKVLVYGVLGYSRSDRYLAPDVPDQPIMSEGISYGFGADVRVTDRVFVGLEYLARNLDTEEGALGGLFPNQSFEGNPHTLSLRVGFKF